MPKQSEQSLRDMIKDHSNPEELVYIETGLWKGEQFFESMKVFTQCWGVELDQHYYSMVYRKTSQVSLPHHDWAILNEDSSVAVPELCVDITNNCFFYLDAHYCKGINPPIQPGKLPLWTELKAINERGKEDIVLVDDVHTFGKNRPDLGTEEWKWVTIGNILKVFLDRVRKHQVIGDALVIWLEEKV